MNKIIRRLRLAFAVVTGRGRFSRTVIEMELRIIMDELKALVATGQDAATRLIDKSSSDASALADANQQIANFEQNAIAAVQPLVDQITSAAPPAAQ